MDRLPIFVLTGFLGSGKTTLLNRLLADPAFAETAVIVNEFGEIGLDHLLIASARERIVLLDAGCLCCVVLDSLRETLADLWQRRAAGSVPPFRRVIVETTGLADPTPILQTMMRDPLITPFFELAGLICVVDALFAESQLEQHPEAIEQVSIADRIVISKTDLSGGVAPPALERRLDALNPSADRLDAAAVRTNPALLLTSRSSGAPWLDALRHGGHHHDSHILSASFHIDHAVTLAGIGAWTGHLRSRHGDDLLRCKAVLEVRGADAPVVVHGVRTAFASSRLPAWPDETRGGRIVLIGRDLDQADLERGLAWLDAPEGINFPETADFPPWAERPIAAGQR